MISKYTRTRESNPELPIMSRWLYRLTNPLKSICFFCVTFCYTYHFCQRTCKVKTVNIIQDSRVELLSLTCKVSVLTVEPISQNFLYLLAYLCFLHLVPIIQLHWVHTIREGGVKYRPFENCNKYSYMYYILSTFLICYILSTLLIYNMYI